MEEKDEWLEYYKNYIANMNKILNKIELLDIEELEPIKEDIKRLRHNGNSQTTIFDFIGD